MIILDKLRTSICNACLPPLPFYSHTAQAIKHTSTTHHFTPKPHKPITTHISHPPLLTYTAQANHNTHQPPTIIHIYRTSQSQHTHINHPPLFTYTAQANKHTSTIHHYSHITHKPITTHTSTTHHYSNIPHKPINTHQPPTIIHIYRTSQSQHTHQPPTMRRSSTRAWVGHTRFRARDCSASSGAPGIFSTTTSTRFTRAYGYRYMKDFVVRQQCCVNW